MGCGSGRWARLVAPRVGTLNCIDASAEALAIARRELTDHANIRLLHATANTVPLSVSSQDFGYSLDLLHHIADTGEALKACTRLLKPGAPFLLYLYYRFDNRPIWFRTLWTCSELLRTWICRMPESPKGALTDLLAALLYWPLARLSALAEKAGRNPSALPLSFYRNKSFYTMRADSRDRFGKSLEHWFTRSEIAEMMLDAGLRDIVFSEQEPYWIALGIKS